MDQEIVKPYQDEYYEENMDNRQVNDQENSESNK